MSLHRIATKFYSEPWLIREDQHASMGKVLHSHLMGRVNTAHAAPVERTSPPPGVLIADGFALNRVAGVIGKHLSFMEMECGGGYDLALLERQCAELKQRDDVHTVVTTFNTPGGIATSVGEGAELIRELAETKRTIAYVDNMACSAGYYLASACDEIYAGPSAIVGSISAYIAILDESRAWEMDGLKMELFTDGDLKAGGMPGKTLSDKQRAFFQERVTQVGGEFKAFVRSRRPHLAEAMYQGGYYSGQGALDAGLVDGFFLTIDHLFANLIDTAANA
ncbi:MAG: S49 family peptidase [Verrucomicrobiota bacterium]